MIVRQAGAQEATATAESSQAAPATAAASVPADDKSAAKTAPPAVNDAATLMAAYKREFAFLEAQKRELEGRLQAFRAKSQQAEQALKQKIASLERENVNMSQREDDLRSALNSAERKDEALTERNELLEMTYSQANSTLRNYRRGLEEVAEYQTGSDADKLGMLFNQAMLLLKDLGSVRKAHDKFFLQDGTEIDGEIVQLGNIAAYGVSSKGSGILIPAGGGRFKLWSLPSAPIAQGLATNQFPDLLQIFLYESKDKAVEERAEKTIIGIIDSGGIIGWVIVCLGVFAMILVVVRTVLLYLASANAKKITNHVFTLLDEARHAEAEAFCSQKKGPFARVLTETLRNAMAQREHIEDIISEALLHESGPLNRFGSTILVIASVSPLLGLLGTVTGMISTFDIITEFGTGDPKLLSSGISVALVTTELGLIVAIPTVLLGTLLTSWSEGIKHDLEEAALRVSNVLLNTRDESIPPTSSTPGKTPNSTSTAGKGIELGKGEQVLAPTS